MTTNKTPLCNNQRSAEIGVRAFGLTYLYYKYTELYLFYHYKSLVNVKFNAF